MPTDAVPAIQNVSAAEARRLRSGQQHEHPQMDGGERVLVATQGQSHEHGEQNVQEQDDQDEVEPPASVNQEAGEVSTEPRLQR